MIVSLSNPSVFFYFFTLSTTNKFKIIFILTYCIIHNTQYITKQIYRQNKLVYSYQPMQGKVLFLWVISWGKPAPSTSIGVIWKIYASCHNTQYVYSTNGLMHQYISGPMHRDRGCFKSFNNLITDLGAELKVAALGGSKNVTNIQ